MLGTGSAHAQSRGRAGDRASAPRSDRPLLAGGLAVDLLGGAPACLAALATELHARTGALGCDHDAVFSDAYLTITQALRRRNRHAGVLRPARPRQS